MNNTFDFNRFSLLVKRQWVENKKLFLMASFALFGLGGVCYSINSDIVTGELSSSIQSIILALGFYLGGSLFTNFTFKDLSDKNATTSFLQIPASHFEKIICAIFYSFIIFPIVFLILHTILDFAIVEIANSIMAKYNLRENTNLRQNFTLIYRFFFTIETFNGKSYGIRENFESLYVYTALWMVTQSFMILGTIMFSKWSFIKTGFAGLILFFLLFCIGSIANETLVKDLSNHSGGTLDSQIQPTKELLGNIIWIFLKYVFTPILLLIAYFKLKEKQV